MQTGAPTYQGVLTALAAWNLRLGQHAARKRAFRSTPHVACMALGAPTPNPTPEPAKYNTPTDGTPVRA